MYNTARLHDLADFLETNPDRFMIHQFFGSLPRADDPDQRPVTMSPVTPADFVKDCGTVACLAGWTLALHGARIVPGPNMGSRYKGQAAVILGIDPWMGERLFEPDRNIYDWDSITALVAAHALRQIATTGEFSWIAAGARERPEQ